MQSKCVKNWLSPMYFFFLFWKVPYLRTHHPTQGHVDIVMFSFNNFIVLCLHLHVWSIFSNFCINCEIYVRIAFLSSFHFSFHFFLPGLPYVSFSFISFSPFLSFPSFLCIWIAYCPNIICWTILISSFILFAPLSKTN